jgi:hypothetical protein
LADACVGLAPILPHKANFVTRSAWRKTLRDYLRPATNILPTVSYQSAANNKMQQTPKAALVIVVAIA